MIEQVLAFYFDTIETADDASIVITAPLSTAHKQLLAFKVEAPGAEKIAVLFDQNPQPLIMTMTMAINQAPNNHGLMVGRARLSGSGNLHCYALRNGGVGHAALKIAVAGHWQKQPSAGNAGVSYQTTIKVIKAAHGYQVMCEILHPMQAARIHPLTGQKINANYITQVTFKVNHNLAGELLLGKYVAKNPVVGINIAALRQGDEIIVQWQDISGRSGRASQIMGAT